MKKYLSVFYSIVLVFAVLTDDLLAQSEKVPGIVINHIPASTQTYIGSPSICILPEGDYIATHDIFGTGSSASQSGVILVFISKDKGKSWVKISQIDGQMWSTLFLNNNSLYLLGTSKIDGNIVIRRSDDSGKTWSNPENESSGLLAVGHYHTAPVPVTVHNGRIWRGFEKVATDPQIKGNRYQAMMISAPANSDLLNSSVWTETNCIQSDSTFLDGNFISWLEGNAVATPEGKMVDFMRAVSNENGRDLAAIVNISDDGTTAAFDPATGFMDFVGGSRKFTIRYDEKSKKYWTICNMVKKEFSGMPAASVRNTLIIKSSKDLKNWNVHKILLHHPDVLKHGFQYADWQFDGRDIIFLSRTAFDDEAGGANNYHDANYLTFHRIKNFRKLSKTNVTAL